MSRFVLIDTDIWYFVLHSLRPGPEDCPQLLSSEILGVLGDRSSELNLG